MEFLVHVTVTDIVRPTHELSPETSPRVADLLQLQFKSNKLVR